MQLAALGPVIAVSVYFTAGSGICAIPGTRKGEGHAMVVNLQRPTLAPHKLQSSTTDAGSEAAEWSISTWLCPQTCCGLPQPCIMTIGPGSRDIPVFSVTVHPLFFVDGTVDRSPQSTL